MNAGITRELYDARPFVPFTMADGRKLTVPHNEFFSLFPSGRFAVLAHEGDRFTVIDLLMVTSVDLKAGGAKGGKREKKA